MSKLNDIALTDIGDVNGVLKADIEHINSVRIDPINDTAPTSGFLFTYSGAAVAFSVRSLNNNATSIMRVRRDSDDLEADVLFDTNDELSLSSPINRTDASETTLGDFVGHGVSPTSAFCVAWYDQSSNQRHAEQPTAGGPPGGGTTLQPKVYDSATGLVTENTKPALNFDGGDRLAFNLPAMNTWTQHELFWVNQSSDGAAILLRGGTANPWLHLSQTSTSTNISDWITPASDYTAFRKDGAAAFASSTTRTQYKAAYYDGVQHLVTVQGTASSNFTTSSFSIGDYSGFEYAGTLQELIMYVTTDQGSNVSSIESDIMTYFSIT